MTTNAEEQQKSLTDSIHTLDETVIVRATRTKESWLSSPAAVSIVDRDARTSTTGRGIDDYLRGIPGVLVQSRSGGQDVRLTIRGFGSRGSGERSNAGTSRGVKILVDGIPETEPDGRTSFDFIDPIIYGSTEVIRSNSTTLWGNAAGGVVNFRSSLSGQPLPRAALQSSFGSFGFRRSSMQSELKFDSIHMLATVIHSRNNGWRTHSAGERTLADFRMNARLDPRTHLIAGMAYSSNLFDIPGPLTPSEYVADPSQAQDDTANYRPTYVARDERRFNRLGRLSILLDHDHENGFGFEASAFITPKVLQRSERNTFRDFNRYHVGGGVLSYIPMSAGESSRSRLFIGADYAYQDGAILFYDQINGQRGTNLQQNKREGAGSGGVFSGIEFSRTTGISISAALRYDAVSYYYDDRIKPNLNDSRVFDQLTPKLSLKFRPNESVTFFTGFGGGFEAPAGNETDPPSTFGEDTVQAINSLLEPIQSFSYELGVKFQKNGIEGALKAVQAELVGYLISTRNELIPYRNGRFYFPAGKTTRAGLECAGDIHWNGGLTQRFSLTLSSNSYREYMVDSIHYGVAGASADFSGNEIAGVPSMYYSTAIGYESKGRGQFFGEVEMQGIGSYFVDDANLVNILSHLTFGLTAGMKKLSIGEFEFSISGGVRNLTNQKYISSGFVNPDRNRNTNEPIYIEPGLPRNLFVNVSVGLR